jgi:hypothetical protein
MSVRVMHVGLHKSGSTFLQKTVFPAMAGVNYLEGFALGDYLRRGDADLSKIPLISTEGGLGWPYPLTEGPNYERLDFLIELFAITHVILVVREFRSWTRSLYFQTIKEGGVLSIEDWCRANTGLARWKNVRAELEERLGAHGVKLLVLSQEQLREDRTRFLGDLCAFIDVEVPALEKSGSHNVSRYGTLTIALARLVNRIIPNGTLRTILRGWKLDPRDQLLFGKLGRLTEALSSGNIQVSGPPDA